MEASGNNLSTSSALAPLPLNYNCPLDAVKPSIRTATSRHCNLLCYIDFGRSIHHSHSLLCNFILAFEPTEPSAPNLRTEQTSFRQAPPPRGIMPRLRHRMSRRRGSNRGRLQRSSPSPVSNSSSPSSTPISGQYPDTCSGRSRRGRTQVVHPLSPHSRPSATASPSSSQPTPHSAQFTYQSTLNQPIIRATIKILFQQEPSSDGGPPTQATQNRDTAQGETDTAQGEPSTADHIQACQMQEDTGRMQEDEEDIDEYKCFIIEEQPTTANDN